MNDGRTYVDFTCEWECERLGITLLVTGEAEFSHDRVPGAGFGNGRSYETAHYLEDVAVKRVELHRHEAENAETISLEQLAAIPLTSEERKHFWESVDEAALEEGLD